jgi:hypothetical protein
VTFRTGKLAFLIVAAPTRGRVALAPRCAYLDYVRAHLRVGHLDALMAAVAARSSSVAAVLEIIETQSRQRPFSKLQRSFRVGVADAALAKLLRRLMRVTAITLLMGRVC